MIIISFNHHQNCHRHHHLYLYLPVCLEPTGRFASGECSQVQALLQTGQQTNLVTMMMIIDHHDGDGDDEDEDDDGYDDIHDDARR